MNLQRIFQDPIIQRREINDEFFKSTNPSVPTIAKVHKQSNLCGKPFARSQINKSPDQQIAKTEL